jgi:hypothetical protein
MKVQLTNEEIRRAWLASPSNHSKCSESRQNFWRQMIRSKLIKDLPNKLNFLFSIIRPVYPQCPF